MHHTKNIASYIPKFMARLLLTAVTLNSDWEPPQIKDLKLVIPEHNIFMASNVLFIALGILDKHVERTTQIRSTLPPWVIQNIS